MIKTMCSEKTPRILSIQSHVVSGYVGNKSATFPLQVNTVEKLESCGSICYLINTLNPFYATRTDLNFSHFDEI